MITHITLTNRENCVIFSTSKVKTYNMNKVYKGVASASQERRTPNLSKERVRTESVSDSIPNVAAEQNPLQNLMSAGLEDKDGQIDTIKLEEILITALESDTDTWSDIVEDYAPHVEKILEDLRQGTEFENLHTKIDSALGSMRQTEELRAKTEEEISQAKTTAEEIASSSDLSSAEQDAEYEGLIAQFTELSNTIDNKQLELVALTKTKGFFARMFSPAIRSLKHEIQNLERKSDMMSQIISEKTPSVAQLKNISASGSRDRAQANQKKASKWVNR